MCSPPIALMVFSNSRSTLSLLISFRPTTKFSIFPLTATQISSIYYFSIMKLPFASVFSGFVLAVFSVSVLIHGRNLGKVSKGNNALLVEERLLEVDIGDDQVEGLLLTDERILRKRRKKKKKKRRKRAPAPAPEPTTPRPTPMPTSSAALSNNVFAASSLTNLQGFDAMSMDEQYTTCLDYYGSPTESESGKGSKSSKSSKGGSRRRLGGKGGSSSKGSSADSPSGNSLVSEVRVRSDNTKASNDGTALLLSWWCLTLFCFSLFIVVINLGYLSRYVSSTASWCKFAEGLFDDLSFHP
jgi:hypothetical protein